MMSRSNVCCAIACLLTPAASFAAPFSPFEARGFAMGGAGVASAEYAAATLYNPALLAIKSESNRFSFIAPSFGVAAVGNDGAVQSSQDFADSKSLDSFSNAADEYARQLDLYQDTQTNGDTLNRAAANLKTASNALLRDLNGVNQKAFQIGAGGAFALAFPKWEYKAALSVSNETFARVTLDVAQSDLNNAKTTFEQIVKATGQLTGDIAGDDASEQVFVEENGKPKLKFDGDAVESRARVLGVSVTDIGVSMAKEFSLMEQRFMVGITPKIQNIATIAQDADIDSDTVKFNDAKKTYTGFNLDVGLAKQFEEGRFQNVRVGVVIRNLIPHTYKTVVPGQDVKISPQVRVGAAYNHKFFTITSDLDVTSNKIVGTGKDASQVFALGAEVNAWSIAKLRAGYRNDFKAKYGALTAGISLFGLQISGAYAKDREAAVLAQFSGSF